MTGAAQPGLGHNSLVRACEALKERFAAAKAANASVGPLLGHCMELANEAYRSGRSDLAVSILSPACEAKLSSAQPYFLLALAHRDQQDLKAARESIAKAAALAPDDPEIAFAHAQFSFEGWRPASRLFRDAQRLAPKNLNITKNAAAALYAEGNVDAAIKILARASAENPDWIEGLQQIAKYHILSGRRDDFDQCFRDACGKSPRNLSLRLSWFHMRAQARDWERAKAIIDEGEALFGDQRAFRIARAFIASESGEDDEACALLDALSDVVDPGLDICKVRYFLRVGEPDRAETIAAGHISGESARSFWPYLSLAWRLLGDQRAEWLDREGAFVRAHELPVDKEWLNALGDALRRLHKTKSPYLEQSVRGGTQTDRNLFMNGDPVIGRTRQAVTQAVRDYVNVLAPHQPGHPLLAGPRGEVRFSGSWSVRLGAQGFHSVHTHTDGWISSALYVSLPDAAQMGAPPAGWLSFGKGPPELGLGLPAYCEIEPKEGRLVLFPSTMWHGTTPFSMGERLTIAFDVAKPRR